MSFNWRKLCGFPTKEEEKTFKEQQSEDSEIVLCDDCSRLHKKKDTVILCNDCFDDYVKEE